MNIAGMRVRTTFQKNQTVVDAAANHLSSWSDYYSCWASATEGNGKDTGQQASHTVEEDVLDITVRYCSKVAAVTAKGYRVMVGDAPYEILSIDEIRFKKVARKFHLRRVER